MGVTTFDFDLRPENIATEPQEIRLGERGLSRMLLVDRRQRLQRDHWVTDLPGLMGPHDVFVVNDSKRIPGVLAGRTKTQRAQVELRIVKIETDHVAICRIFPGHFLSPQTVIDTGQGDELLVLEVNLTEYGLCRVRASRPVRDLLVGSGKPITSFFYSDYWAIDNYNPFYSRSEGSVESPMAGLHLTPGLLQAIEDTGATVAYLSLHVVGSWLAPLEEHAAPAFPEPYVIPDACAEAIASTRATGGKVWACGSTVVRTLESAATDERLVAAGEGVSTLCLGPGSPIKVVDHYFTNFHPGRSSLILLDAALCEPELLMNSYHYARDNGYLFFEFGDAVLFY